jgi:hypothetical protein
VGAYGLPACGEDGGDGEEVVPAFVPVGFYGGVDGFASGFAAQGCVDFDDEVAVVGVFAGDGGQEKGV